MIITKNRLFSGILLFGVTFIHLVLFNIQEFYLRAIFSFIFLTTIPGFLISMMLKIRNIGFWEYLVYMVGLSVSFLMIVGLAINWVLPLLKITDKPLALLPLIFIFETTLIIFGFIAYKNAGTIPFKVNLPKLNILSKIFFIIPIVFPVLSILGANTLNNGGSNYLTMTMLGGIAIYVLAIVLFRQSINQNIFPWSLLLLSLSMLLMFSLRSWHILGWDINQEYQMFKITSENLHWSMSYFPRQPYNACLSITLLPTILNAFMNINDEYIFKLFFQIIFSFSPVVVYLFLRKYSKSIVAFLASFLFISQPQFIQSMPSVTRQEFAMLFFFLTILITFNEKINQKIRNILFVLFSFSIIISHYSTSYITAGFFILILTLSYFYKFSINKELFSKLYIRLNLIKPGILEKPKYYFNPKLILVFIICAFLWFSQITKVSENLVDVTLNTINNMDKIFSDEARIGHTSLLNQFNIFYQPEQEAVLLQEYVNKTTVGFKNKLKYEFYFPSEYENYKMEVIDSELLPARIQKDGATGAYILLKVIEISLKIFIVLGVIYITFTKFDKKKVKIETQFMILVSMLMVGAMTVLPVVSLSYPIERLYQQTLIFLSLPAVLGCLVLIRLLKNGKRAIVLTALILLVHFLNVSGFISQLVGISEPLMTLNNSGQIYSEINTHTSEIDATRWLKQANKEDNPVYSDKYGYWQLQAYAQTKSELKEVFPQIVSKDSYVYSNFTNTTKNLGFVEAAGVDIGYNFPTQFLSENKNKIYSNGSTEIYR